MSEEYNFIKRESYVVYLFSKYHEQLGFERVLDINSPFPDCIAQRNGKVVRIEFEKKASGIIYHKPKDERYQEKFDIVVCLENDLLNYPKEVIELKSLLNLTLPETPKRKPNRKSRGMLAKSYDPITHTNSRRTEKDFPKYIEYSDVRDIILRNRMGIKTGERDKALASVIYLGCLRGSEALRLNKSQFSIKKDNLIIENIKLGKKRKPETRTVELSIAGERGELIQLVRTYLKSLRRQEDLFPLTSSRAYTILSMGMNGIFPHALRVLGMNYLLRNDFKEKGMIALAEYLHLTGARIPILL